MYVVSYFVKEHVAESDFAEKRDAKLPPFQPSHDLVHPKLNVRGCPPCSRAVPAQDYFALSLPSRPDSGQSVTLA